jgi:hypothetical protein
MSLRAWPERPLTARAPGGASSAGAHRRTPRALCSAHEAVHVPRSVGCSGSRFTQARGGQETDVREETPLPPTPEPPIPGPDPVPDNS